MSMPAVIVTGSLNMDFVVAAQHLPAPGETVLGSNFRTLAGGKGANQAYAAAKLGAGSVSVRMIGRVGRDVFGDQLTQNLATVGVDVSAVLRCDEPTGVALIPVDCTGQNCIVVAPGANGALKLSDVAAMRAVFRGGSIALFQLETPIAVVEAALAMAREEGLTTVLDPAPAQALARTLLECVDILTPNEPEALMLLGRQPARIGVAEAYELAAALEQLGPRTIILKMGDKGCYVYSKAGAAHHPGFAVKAVDTTAAGDTFNAALAVALAERRPLDEAIRFANAAAAIAVTRVGAQASAPERGEVEDLLT